MITANVSQCLTVNSCVLLLAALLVKPRTFLFDLAVSAACRRAAVLQRLLLDWQ